MNFIIEKYLSNFVEIDTSQTKASIFSGIINLKNLKIKSEIFESLNLPNFEVIHGYIGSMTIKLKMPRFYKYPINVEIEKVFIHIRQKNIDKKLKDEAIKSMEEYKNQLLLNEEELRQKWEKVDNEEPGIFFQIINDLQIEIREVILHYDDTISYKEVPFTLGIILNKMMIRSANKEFVIDENIKENITYQEINYKVFNIDNFSIFMDCFDNLNVFNAQNLSLIADKTDKRLSSSEVIPLETDTNDYFEYCMKELNIFSKSKNSHQYILYKMQLNVKISANNNYLKNNLPQYTVSINLPALKIRFSLKQIKTIFKVMAYYNLNQLYQNGIAKEYYIKKLSEKDINLYIERYISYYQEKFYEKNEKLEFPLYLTNIENGLSFEDIQDMRRIAYKKLDYINEYIKLKKELDIEEDKWYGKDLEKIDKLKKDLSKIERQKEKLEKIQNKNKTDNIKETIKEKYQELNERLSDANSSMIFSLNKIMFFVYENAKTVVKDKQWEYKDILFQLILTNFDIDGKIFQNSIKLSMSLENVVISHEKSKNPNYKKFIFGDIENRGKILHMEFEKNPKFEKSDYKFQMKSEKRIHIIYDNHIFNYINDKIMNILNTTIEFGEINKYARQDSVNEYIRTGYADYFENFQHFNIDLYIDLISPIILLPLDPFTTDDNNKCILLRLGRLEIKSDLPPRQEKDINYRLSQDEKLMYDNYIINLYGTKLSTLTDCTPVNNCVEYQEYETKIIRDFDLFVICKRIIEAKNPFLDDLVCELSISKVEMKLDEFQILLIIDYLGNFFKDNKDIFEENEIDKFLGLGMEKEDELEAIKNFKISKNSGAIGNIKKKKNDPETIFEESIDFSDDRIVEDKIRTEKDENIKEEDEIRTDIKEEDKKSSIKSEDNIYYKKENEEEEDKKSENKNIDKKKTEQTEKKVSFERIKEIKNKKRAMRVKFIMNEMTLTIKKVHYDLSRENFIILIQKIFEVDCFMMDNNDILTLLSMKNIYLYDKDIDTKKNSIIKEQFQCLINSSKSIRNNKMSFIDMTSLYRKINGATEIDTMFDMNDLNIIISFDSLLRIYQFMMYYYDKYNEKMYEIEHSKDVNKKKNSKRLDDIINMSFSSKDIVTRTSRRNYTEAITNKNSLEKYKSLDIGPQRARRRKSNNFGKIIREKIDSKITIIYNMKNTKFKIPLNPKKSNTPIVSFSFDLIYNQYMRDLYTNVLRLPRNLLIEKIYEVQDFNMNLLISKVYLDLEFRDLVPTSHIYENEKIISNFRMSYYSSSFLYIPQKQSMTISNLNLEPLYCKFGVKQMGELLDFYKKLMSFWFDFNNIKYIPYMKPEYIVNGIVVVQPKLKKTFKECVLRIMIALHIRKSFQNHLNIIRAKYKKKNKTKIDNISDFNSHYEMEIKFGKIIITFYDNVSAEKRLLLNFKIFQMSMNSISNTKVKDKNNASNIIYEMITGDDLPIDRYNIDTLGNYMHINFGLEINYFNLIINEYEPLLEKIKFDYLLFQTCSFSRKKNYLNIKDMINFNISSNAIKVINLFLLRYYQKEKKSKKNIIKSVIRNSKKESTIKLDNNNAEPNKEISLLLMNYTELDIDIMFEANYKTKYRLKPKGNLTFYKNDSFLDGNQNNFSSTLNAIVMKNAIIKAINYGRNNTRQYKLKVDIEHKEYHFYINVKVNTSGLIKQVHFCPSISIFNDTNYKEIEIFVKNHKIKKNCIIIPQNEKCFVPITWSLCEPPLSFVYMKVKNNIEPVKIYNHINDAIIKPLDEEEMSQKKNEKKKIEKEAKNNKNKYWNQNVIKSFLSECDNRKDNKTIVFNEENNKIYFCIDYYFVQSKEIKEILKEKEIKMNNIEDTMTSIDEFYNEYSYDYLLYIRPYATFYNQLPFNLTFTHGNSVEKTIKTLNKSSLYCFLQDEEEQIRISFQYNGEKYNSPYFNITNSNSVELINYDNSKNENLSCYILKSTKIVELNKNFNYDVILIGFSSSSYEYTFFFKYLIMNKMPTSLWTKPYKNKKGKMNETELKSGKLTVINSHNINKYIIKEENSRWSKPFNLQTIKEKGTIEIDTEIEKEEKKILSTKDISCIISWGKNYDNSRIAIFQQQFIIHNKLNFNIYYRQDKDNEKINHFLKSQTFESINCIKEKKKIFRLGLFDTNCGEFNYSSPFDIEILKIVDLLIKINELDVDNFDPNYVYTNNNKNYYVLIRIESHIFEDGLIYLSITSPYFPSLKIENETETSIKILESRNDSKPLIVDNKLTKGFPFVWKNNSEEKSSLIFEIYGIQKSFSFSKFGKNFFELEKEEEPKNEESKINISTDNNTKNYKLITYHVYAKNKSLTRCIKIEEKNNCKKSIEPKKAGFNLLIRNSNKYMTSSFNIEIKGIGFSIINEALLELFYISFYSLKIKYLSNLLVSENNTLSQNTQNFVFHLSNFQIDYCLNDSIKYIVAPKKQVLPSNDGNNRNKINEVILLGEKLKSSEERDNIKKEEVPFISFLVTRQFNQYLKTMEESTIYPQIDLIIQQFKCKIDQYTITNLLNIINEFMELLNYSKKIEEEESNNEDLMLLQENTSDRIKKFVNNKNGSKVLINYLFLSSMKIYLTIRLNLSELYTTGFPKIITRIFGSIGNSLTRFTDIPLIFTEKGFENIYISLSEILWIIFEEYKNKGTKQIITILGSSDLIGNPVKLLEGIGTGFYELVNEPRKGFIHGPLQFGKGIAKGIGKLLSGIIGGTFGVVESITGTLYSATQSLMGRNGGNFLDDEEGPNNIASGAIQGLYGGFKELKQGVTGIVLHPMKETKKSGVKGFFKGLGKGLIGFVVSPFAAILRIVHSFVTGTKNTLNLILGNSRIRTKRFRHPRALLEGIEPLRPYDFEKAEAKEALFKVMKIETNHIDYAHYFICADKGFDKGFSLFLKTDKIIVVLYEAKKIIFSEKLRSIKKCEIHFVNEEYVIKFCRTNGTGRGFKVMKEFYTIVCKIYDLFSENKMKELEKKTIFTSDIKIENEQEDNNKDDIININDVENDNKIDDNISLDNEKKETKKEEIININNIYNINNINNIFNINNINNIQNIYSNNQNNNSSKSDKTANIVTIENENSVYFANTNENFSNESEFSKQLTKRINKVQTRNESSFIKNSINSRDYFVPKKILMFSDSSNSK